MKPDYVTKGAPEAAVAYAEDVLVQQHQKYHQATAAEAEEKRSILSHLREVEARFLIFTIHGSAESGTLWSPGNPEPGREHHTVTYPEPGMP